MTQKNSPIKIALIDDHVLLRNALAVLIGNFNDCIVITQAGNGKELVAEIEKGKLPDIVLLDLNMPVMDGLETATWLHTHHPGIHILMLTMYDSELALIRLLQAGVKGFLKKDIHPAELHFALQSVMQSGYYYSHTTTGKLINLFRKQAGGSLSLEKNLLNENELRFLELAGTEMTYKEIALTMGLNPRAVDNLRDNLFEKLEVKSRVGLVMYAIKHGVVRF